MRQIASVEEQLKGLPDGSLICVRKGDSYKYYHYHNHLKKYLSKKEYSTVEQLSLKKYLTFLLDELMEEKNALEFYFRHHNPNSETDAQQLLLSEPHATLLKKHFLPKDVALRQWMQDPYPGNPFHPEGLIHLSPSGNKVRSKSEAIIDTLLFTNHIPYRYECALQLGPATIYPDFTIHHPITGKTFYWEHFGIMDNPEYAHKAFQKLELYNANGITPSIQLITTYESKDYPLSIEHIQNVISFYFQKGAKC